MGADPNVEADDSRRPDLHPSEREEATERVAGERFRMIRAQVRGGR